MSDLDAVTLLSRCGSATTDREVWAVIPDAIDGHCYRAWGSTGGVGGLFVDEFVAREGAVVTLKRS